MRFIYPLLLLLQVVLGDIGVPVESPTREELKHVPDIEDQEISKADTSGLSWGEPISEAEKTRARGIAGEKPSAETMARVRKGLENEMRRDGRSIQRALSARWPNGRIPYKIESVFTNDHRAIIASGIANVEDNTCVEFVEATAADEDWMEIYATGVTSCFANARFLGPGYGKHEVGLDIGDASGTCVTKGVVVHELLHILGVAHEQQRPDRDTYVTMHWTNIQVSNSYNMWRDSWDTEDVASLTKCNSTGVSQNTADFSNCVSGDTVTDFGVGYDFKSVMHYGLKSFAVDSNLNVMTPKNASINANDVGGDELSAMDIKKLNYAYYCDGTTKVSCGGSVYSATGGSVDGNPLSGQSSCEFLLRTDDGKGVQLNLITNFVGTCEEDYLEVRVGGRNGILIGKYCQGQDLPSALQVPTTALWMVWKKSSASASMSGTWTTYAISCCETMVITVPERSDLTGTWTKVSGVESGGRSVFVAPNGRFLAWNTMRQSWGVVDSYPSDSFYAQNKNNYFCPSDLTSGWEYYEGSDVGYLTSSEGAARCSNCDYFPQYDECAICCDTVTSTSTTANTLTNFGYFLGQWSLFSTPEHNGKKVYSLDKGPDYCLKAKPTGQWMIGFCGDLTDESGWGFGGNDKCVRQTSGWQVFINSVLVNDNNFQITCENPPTPTAVPTTPTTPTTGPTTPATPTPGQTIPATPTTGPTTTTTPTAVPTTPTTPTTGPTTPATPTNGPTTPTTGPTTPATPTTGPTTPATPTTGPTTSATPTTGPNTPATPTTGPTTAAISTAGPTTQATPCYECKNVLNGPLQGIYTLRNSGDSRCGDGCSYYKDNEEYCFEEGGYETALQCPTTTPSP